MGYVGFDASMLVRQGRLHTLGVSVFSYPGAIFHPHDFLPEATGRLITKLDSVIDTTTRMRLYEAAHPAQAYDLDEASRAFPRLDISDADRQRLRLELCQTIFKDLPPRLPASDLSPVEQQAIEHLGRLPNGMLEWAYRKNMEFAFAPERSPAPAGALSPTSYARLYPHHPAFTNVRSGGGSVMRYEAANGREGPIAYCYFSPGNRINAIVAHELGHALYHAAEARYGKEAMRQAAEAAAVMDAGDLNKIPTDNPQPDLGRLGQLQSIAGQKEMPWQQKLIGFSLIDPEHLPRFLDREDAERWVNDLCEILPVLAYRASPKSGIYRDPIYKKENLFAEEYVADTANHLTQFADKRAALRFALPQLTTIYDGILFPMMREELTQLRRLEKSVPLEAFVHAAEWQGVIKQPALSVA